ncbi:terpene synthase 10-like [Pistacia vera]|uniref:terpene synthase 10-like n=1 Tax=Pistacia vera TaxID=55513 RepID=UPI0012632527|nr:terpene synthase 10-like [Pistacia vera]
MALYCQVTSPPSLTFKRLPPLSSSLVGSSSNIVGRAGRSVLKCIAATKTSDETIVRRSANYPPSIWSHDYVQSLTSNYVGEPFAKRVEKLKEEVRLMLNSVDPLNQLELIDDLERLGVSYHFQDEIKRILNKIHNNNSSNYKQREESLHAATLEFRLLRQHGYDIPTEIFDNFRDEKGNFRPCLKDDCRGILSMYDAAFLLKEGENAIFDDVRNFTTSYLKEYVKENKDQYLSTVVSHELELPRYWRMPRLEARWFIDVYETRPDMNSIVLELAKLDFNMVQATHQEDMKSTSRKWKKMGLGDQFSSFARDSWMICFFWATGTTSEPQYGYCRIVCAIVNALITSMDDVYDVYGTLDELEILTEAIDRWDVNKIEQLPHFMKIFFLALYNFVNESGFDVVKEHAVDIIPYLKKSWTDLSKAYLLEAKWYKNGYTPTLKEYMDNAWNSISAPVILIHTYFSSTNPLPKEPMKYFEEYSDIIKWSSIILRLANDMGTSSYEIARGDTPKSINCYMHETGASEEEAREHIQKMIAATWMKMNRDRLGNPYFPETFVTAAMNLGRTAQCVYQYGDGHAIEESFKDRIMSLFFDPIPLMNGDGYKK